MSPRLLIPTLMLLSPFAFAQRLSPAHVPEPAKASFKRMHPGAKGVKWEKENDCYEANVKRNGKNESALFDAAGHLLEVETEIDVKELPAKVLEYVSKNLAGKKIREAAKIVDARNETTFEVEVDHIDYLFDAEGRFIRKDEETVDTRD